MPPTLRPAFPDAATFVSAWDQGVQRNADRWLAGIQNPRARFNEAAVQKKGAWTTAMQAAISGDHYGKAMATVDADAAIATAVAVGSQGYATGASLRKDKLQKIMAKLAPAMAQAVATVRNMPASSDTDRENRAVAMIRAFRKLGKKGTLAA